MPGEINFFDTYTLNAITKEIVPEASFFRDRYFPTGANDIFATDKVLTEYQKGDRKMACFVAPRVGDIPVARDGYAIHEYKPAFIAPSRELTLDDLAKRGFGEAIYANSTPAQRAARLQLEDQTDLDRRIARREEWMAVQTIINNGCDMQEYIDANTVGDVKHIQFYDGISSDHLYTVDPTKKWGTSDGNVAKDVEAMCRLLARRGLPAADLVLGTDAAEAIVKDAQVNTMLNMLVNLNNSAIDEEIVYPGVTRMGLLNFHGFKLNVFNVSESYDADNGTDTAYLPAKAAIVTAPGCGHTMYGQITQINYGDEGYTSYAAKRVPKLIVDQEHDIRKIRLGSRPLTAPKNYCPYIYSSEVC